MKIVGHRRQPDIAAEPSGERLAEGARFSEAVAALCPSTFVPKGVYRYSSHEAANRHAQECLARGMALAARRRE